LQGQGAVFVQRQEQRQKLSPQMLQSIKLMTLPVQDLAARIFEELETNPALKVVKDKRAVSLDGPGGRVGERRDEPYRTGAGGESAYGARDGRSRGQGSFSNDAKRMFIEGTVSRPETLQEHLLWQLRLQPISDRDRGIGETLIRNLGPDGFHEEPLDSLFTGADLARAAEIARMVSAFEPAGCCVADYRESLLAQASQEDDCPPEALPLISEHLHLLERGKHAEIAKKLKITEERLATVLGFMRALHPFPGRQYSSEETLYVVPDLMVKPKDGDFVIILNDEEIPVLGLDEEFAGLAVRGARRADGAKAEPAKAVMAKRQAADYARKSVRDARFFINSIHQRNKTLLKVARSVVELQRPFFIKGPKYIEPLTLKVIADEVGVHETTVSRIASRKYMQTEWGIFELRHFFTNAVSGAAGSRFSKQGVKEMIREIIGEETTALSDQGIADLLAEKGVKIARRTVAKYRNELKMNTSFDR
jgi:RNA polymerase sigma-54 factor